LLVELEPHARASRGGGRRVGERCRAGLAAGLAGVERRAVAWRAAAEPGKLDGQRLLVLSARGGEAQMAWCVAGDERGRSEQGRVVGRAAGAERRARGTGAGRARGVVGRLDAWSR
jgi:hypothetical protein